MFTINIEGLGSFEVKRSADKPETAAKIVINQQLILNQLSLAVEVLRSNTVSEELRKDLAEKIEDTIRMIYFVKE